MKKLLTLLVALIAFNSAKTANYYTFANTTSTYTELSNATTITTTFDVENYDLVIGNFKLFGQSFDTIEVKAFGGMFGINHATNRMAAIDGFGVKKFLSRDNTSSISYTFEGTTGARILKVQYKNVTPRDGDATKDYANFQIWLYENGDKIELHYGTSNISDPSKVFTFDTDKGPLAGIFLSDVNFMNKYEIQWLRGDPSNPSISTNITSSLSGIPASGRTYVYEHKVIVEQPKLDLVSPIAMEIWKAGEQREIKWTSKLIRKIKIEYAFDGFTEFNVIVDSVDAAPGKYLWTVPNTVSDACFVRISDVDQPTRKSETAIPFAIKPAGGTGVNETELGFDFKIFPNPGTGLYTITSTTKNATAPVINICSLDGKIIYSKTFTSLENNTIDISHAPSGIYLLKIHTNNTVLTKIIVKN